MKWDDDSLDGTKKKNFFAFLVWMVILMWSVWILAIYKCDGGYQFLVIFFCSIRVCMFLSLCCHHHHHHNQWVMSIVHVVISLLLLYIHAHNIYLVIFTTMVMIFDDDMNQFIKFFVETIYICINETKLLYRIIRSNREIRLICFYVVDSLTENKTLNVSE